MRETRHQFREDLVELEHQVLGGLDLVISQLDRAQESIAYQDVELASMVVADDDRIDGRYLEVHQGILSMLARQAPVASDLRIVAALLHVIRCIERMGDQCVNIAKLVPLSGYESPKDKDILDAIEKMGLQARSQVVQAKQALGSRNVQMAQDLVRQDAGINRLNRDIFKRAVEIGDDIDMREWGMFMILVARCLERIGDNTVDIAEQVVFVVTGLFREMDDAAPPSATGSPPKPAFSSRSRARRFRARSLATGPMAGVRGERTFCGMSRGGRTSDRRVRRRRLLDGVGQHAARRPRAVADRRGSPEGLLSADRRPATPTTTWCGSTARFPSSVCEPSHISLFRRETGVGDPRAHLLDQDLIYVGGGSLVSLMGTWQAHGIDEALSEAWQAGVLLCGGSAGSLCWFCEALSGFHEGPQRRLRGLGFLPWSNAVHYNEEPGRRTAFLDAIADGMPAGYGVGDGAALHFVGTELAEVVSSRPVSQARYAYVDDSRRDSRGGSDGPLPGTPVPLPLAA